MALKWAVPWRPSSDNSAKLEVPRALAQPMAGGIHFLQRMAMSRSLMMASLEQPVLRKKFQLGIRRSRDAHWTVRTANTRRQ